MPGFVALGHTPPMGMGQEIGGLLRRHLSWPACESHIQWPQQYVRHSTQVTTNRSHTVPACQILPRIHGAVAGVSLWELKRLTNLQARLFAAKYTIKVWSEMDVLHRCSTSGGCWVVCHGQNLRSKKKFEPTYWPCLLPPLWPETGIFLVWPFNIREVPRFSLYG